MNSKLEKLMLTRDFGHLSSNDKLFVAEFMTESEYADCRVFLMRSNEVFHKDKVSLKQPKIDKKLLLKAYREKYNVSQLHPDSNHKNVFYYLSNPMITGVAALFIIGLFIFNFNNNVKSSNSDPKAVTDWLLQGKELPLEMDKDLQSTSNNTKKNLLVKEDSVLKVLQTMHRQMTIETYTLETIHTTKLE